MRLDAGGEQKLLFWALTVCVALTGLITSCLVLASFCTSVGRSNGGVNSSRAGITLIHSCITRLRDRSFIPNTSGRLCAKQLDQYLKERKKLEVCASCFFGLFSRGFDPGPGRLPASPSSRAHSQLYLPSFSCPLWLYTQWVHQLPWTHFTPSSHVTIPTTHLAQLKAWAPGKAVSHDDHPPMPLCHGACHLPQHTSTLTLVGRGARTALLPVPHRFFQTVFFISS